MVILLCPFFSSKQTPTSLHSGVVIEVVDNGPGISKEDLPHIFQRAYRGKQALDSGIPGSGLGLAIARDLMRGMGGDLKVANKEKGAWGAGAMLFLPRCPLSAS